MKYIASVSFGKDSLAMLLKLIELNYPLDIVLFYNTKMEFNCIYDIRDKIKCLLNNKNIEFVELTSEEPFLYTMLEREVHSKDGTIHYGYSWCGGTCRWHTTAKLKAIKKYKDSLNDDIIDYVGIAYDEPNRFEKAKCEGKVLPLVEWKMTEKDCLNYCRSLGWSWIEDNIDLYDILDRVSCWCCANKNLKELKNIYKYLPSYWSKLKDLQSKTMRPIKAKYSIYDLEKRFVLEEKWLFNGKNIHSREFYIELQKIINST